MKNLKNLIITLQSGDSQMEFPTWHRNEREALHYLIGYVNNFGRTDVRIAKVEVK